MAAQAPRKNMISAFWQMVLDQKVSVIVMITRIAEKEKVKALKYWPDNKKHLLELQNDVNVTFDRECYDSYRDLERSSFTVTSKGIIF